MASKFNVIGTLLNDESLGIVKNMDITYIPREKIVKNEKNEYSISNIEGLAQDIQMGGLEQPLIVYKMGEDLYKLLGGERRLTAIDSLIKSGRWRGDIPCIIKSMGSYELPLPDDLKELYSIMRTNAFNRRPTETDILKEMTGYKKIIKELKKRGYKYLFLGYDENNEPVSKNIEGRAREVVADLLGVSTGQLSKYEKVNKKADDTVKKTIREKKIKIAVAEKLADIPKKEQQDFIKKSAGKMITNKDVQEYLNERQPQRGKEKAENPLVRKKCQSCNKLFHVYKNDIEEDLYCPFCKSNTIVTVN